MFRFLAMSLLAGHLALGCAKKAEPESRKARAGDTVEATLDAPECWKHGTPGIVSVSYSVERVGRGRMRLEAADLPADFRPDIEVTFEADGCMLGEPVRLPFDPDC